MIRVIRTLFLLIALHAAPAAAQVTDILLAYRYDLDSTSGVYCSLAKEVDSGVRVAAASSTTLTGTNAFASVAVGDVLVGKDSQAGGGESYLVTVTAKASDSSVTIDTAKNLSSATMAYRTLSCGTSSTSGEFSPEGFVVMTFQVDFEQGTTTGGVNAWLECKASPFSAWAQVYPLVNEGSAAGTTANIPSSGNSWIRYPFVTGISTLYHRCRIGLKITTADDGTDTGSDQERITVVVRGRARN